jgi:hypothetical protein
MFVSLIQHMKNKSDNLSPQQSLEIISQMIQQAQGNISKNSFYFLLWGWVIAIANFGMYSIVKFTPYPKYAPLMWFLSIPAWIATVIYANKHAKEQGTVTHLDTVTKWLWICMALAILPVWIFGAKINWNVNAIVLMPIGIATFLMGIIIRFKPLLFGGATFWVASVLCYLVSPVDQCLIAGIAVMLGYLVPGYMLRNIKE